MRNPLMDPERWRRVRELVEQFRGEPPSDRDTALDAVCAGDEGLAAEVRSLLDSVESAGALIDSVVSRAVATLAEDAVAGRRVGPYRIVRELGHGGMGAVYLAERADGEFEQQVALKLIRPGLDTEHFLRRFRAERQILASLQHPHIARLLDGGIDDGGQPYFAMEYVEGESIDRYCRRHELPIDERLALFQDACRAVSHAHANLVIHRDLKPAHILVTADRQVRLLDFGIARMLSEEGEDAAGLTQVGIQALTPEYASPEQVRGEAVSTSTDVYSLGVILYELLTGDRPYHFDVRTPAEIERVICERQPEKPSTRAGQSWVGRVAPAEGPLRRPPRDEGLQLRRRLRGDLDVICLKALQKDAARRYPSVEALSEDIRRNLAGLPVLARPDSAGYRLGKFVTRHRVGVGVAAAVLIAFVSLAGYHTIRLAGERDRARLEADKAEQVATFLRNLFEVSDPSESKGRTITARELLDAGAERIERELRGQPDVRASMLLVMGDVYRTLGLHDQARTLLAESLEEHRKLYGPEDERVAESMAALGSVLQDAGDFAAAEPLFRDSLAMRQRLLGPRHELVGESLELLAFLRETRGDVDEAERLNREAVAIHRGLFPPGDLRIAHSVAELAGLLRRTQRGEEAEPLLREALAAQVKVLGPDDLTVASTKRNLAALLRDRGAFDEAETLLREVVDTRRRILGDTHPEFGVALNSLALLLDRKGDVEGAIRTYREFLTVLEQVHAGRPHPDVAAAYNNLAGSLRVAGRLDDAVEMYRRSIRAVDAVLAPDHANRAFARQGLAVTYIDEGQFAAAEPLLREALSIRRKGLTPGHRYIGDTLVELGVCLTGLKRYGEAEAALREALALFSDGPGRDRARAQRAQSRLDRLRAARSGNG
jgi:serine/threonine-protein kinase